MLRHTSAHPVAALLLGATLALAACGVDDEEESANPIEEIGAEVDGGNAGPDESVTEEVTLADVELPYPAEGVWSAGEDVPLSFALTNTGRDPVALESITGEDFADALIATADDAAALEVAGDDNLYVGAEGPPSVLLLDVDLDLRSSQSIPVTFTFEDGQEVTVDAVVAAATGTDVPEQDEDPTPDS